MRIGLSWGAVWAALFATIALIIGVVRPEDIDPGEGPLVASGIGFIVGFVSGAVWGIVLAFAENRKSIHDLSLIRVAIWGMLGSAAWPLLTPLPNSMLLILCPLGAVCAVASVVIARRADVDGSNESALPMGWINRLFAGPLKAACSSNE